MTNEQSEIEDLIEDLEHACLSHSGPLLVRAVDAVVRKLRETHRRVRQLEEEKAWANVGELADETAGAAA